MPSEKNTGWSREEFLEANPDYVRTVETIENWSGALERYSSFNFKDGRWIALFRFEKNYRLEFQEEPDSKEINVVTLSHEAVAAISYLYRSMSSEENLAADILTLKSIVANQKRKEALEGE